MGSDKWIVNNTAGEEWGIMKRLIIDSTTRQISYADVVLADSGELIRLPWKAFQVRSHGITLRIDEGQVIETATSVQQTTTSATVVMDLWP
jgi:hypothetical protein